MLTKLRQIQEVLPPRGRRRVLVLLALMVVGTMLESLSVGMVVPILGVLADPTWITKVPLLQDASHWVGATSTERLAVWAMLAFIAVYAVKTCFAVTLAYSETRFAYATQADLSNRLYSGYLRQPWTFHLQRNSAELIRNATGEPQLLALYLLAALRACSECLIVLALCALLVTVEPVGALAAVAVMGLAGVAYPLATRRRVRAWGIRRQELERHRLKQLQQGLGAVKVAKVLGREPHFEQLFARDNYGYTRALQRQQFTSQLPRLWLEAVTVVGIATLVITLVMQDHSLTAALPTLGLFGAAAFRLLPSISRIVTSSQTLRFYGAAVDVVHRELALVSPSGSLAPTTDRLVVDRIQLEHVSYRYPAAAELVLRDLTLSVEAGMTVGFVGPSGAGKSTLVDLILGLLPPSAGTISVGGADIQRNLRAWQNSIGYVPQSIYLVDDTIRKNVAFGIPNAEVDDDRVWHALREASIDEFVRALPQGLDTVTGERGVRLSGGQQQRIGIARALYHDPDVLVLDEATSALDSATEAEVMGAIGALHRRKTVIIVAHRLTTLAKCDVIYQVRNGTLTAAEVLGAP